MKNSRESNYRHKIIVKYGHIFMYVLHIKKEWKEMKY